MKSLIVANWKMNPVSQKEAEEIFNEIKNGIAGVKSEVVICPPFLYLSRFKGIALGAQNVCFEEKGAFTGEISPAMLKDLGVEYVIVGHSERKKYFAETDEVINKKIKKALEFDLKIIFCVGETQDQHDNNEKYKVLETQIKNGLKDTAEYKLLTNLIIAYEPVWAIGTGNNCSADETKESIKFIKKQVSNGIKILYGGSVKSENSGDYVKKAGANGLLVGGASLDAEEFIKIVKSAE